MGYRSTGVCFKIFAKYVLYVIHIFLVRILPFALSGDEYKHVLQDAQ